MLYRRRTSVDEIEYIYVATVHVVVVYRIYDFRPSALTGYFIDDPFVPMFNRFLFKSLVSTSTQFTITLYKPLFLLNYPLNLTMDSNGRAPPPDNDLAPGDNAAGFYDLTTNHIEATISRKVANTLKKASAAAALAAEIEVTNKITFLHFECVQAKKTKNTKTKSNLHQRIHHLIQNSQ